jgi:hypothetical protein
MGVVQEKMLNHTWYLTPENVCFSLFDEDVTNEEKRKIINNIK